MRRRSLFALTGALMLSACALPTLTVTPAALPSAGPGLPGASPGSVLPAAGVAAQAGVTVSGAVKVPAGIIAAGGMNLVAAGSGNLVAAGSGNLVAAGGMNYGLLALSEAPAAGAEVFLADAAGNPIPGLEKVKTDAKGNFTIPGVPPDFTFVVAAEITTIAGKKATFQTLAKPGKLGATVNLDAATTLVASNVLEGQKGSDLGDFNPAIFKTAAETTARNLDDAKLPDFSDRASVRAKMAELIAAVSELKASVDQLRTELSEVKKSLDDLRAALEKPATDAAPPAPGTDPGRLEPPPPTTRPGSPAPDGTQPATCPRVGHQFMVPDPTKVAFIEFKVPTPDKPREQWMNASTAKRDAGYWADVPEGCPLLVLFKNDRGEVVHAIDNFAIRVGAEKQVRFDLPPTGTATSAPGTPRPEDTPRPEGTPSPGVNTGTCTEPRPHRFKLRSTNVAFLLFDVPNSGDPPRHAAEGHLAADGSWEAAVPEGCPHDVKAFDENWQFVGGLKGYVIPAGAAFDHPLAL